MSLAARGVICGFGPHGYTLALNAMAKLLHAREAPDGHQEIHVDGALIRELADLLKETGLSEIEIGEGERRVRVARGAPTNHDTSVEPARAVPIRHSTRAGVTPGGRRPSPRRGNIANGGHGLCRP